MPKASRGRLQLRSNTIRTRISYFLGLLLSLSAASYVYAETVPVRFAEATSRGFLALRDEDGKIIASGEMRQTSKGNQITGRLTFRFRDGSLDDETTTYTQHLVFRLVSDHHIQRGPSFPHPIDMTIDVPAGTVTTLSDDSGTEKTEVHHMTLPPDVANGLVVSILKNLRPEMPKTEVSMVFGGSKPRLTKLAILPDGEENYVVAGSRFKARRVLIKIELGPLTKVAVEVMGKMPADGHAWVSEGTPASMLRADDQLYENGPIWRIELATPQWGTYKSCR